MGPCCLPTFPPLLQQHNRVFHNNKRQGTKEGSGVRAGFIRLCPLSADTASQLDVLGHDGDALRVDGAKVGVLKQAHLKKFETRKDHKSVKGEIRGRVG